MAPCTEGITYLKEWRCESIICLKNNVLFLKDNMCVVSLSGMNIITINRAKDFNKQRLLCMYNISFFSSLKFISSISNLMTTNFY